MHSYFKFWKYGLNFKRKSNLKDYWTAKVVNLCIFIILLLLSSGYENTLHYIINMYKIGSAVHGELASATMIFPLIWFLLTYIPDLANLCRRFNDVGIRPFFFFLSFIVLLFITSKNLLVLENIFNILYIVIALLPTNFLKNLKRQDVKK